VSRQAIDNNRDNQSELGVAVEFAPAVLAFSDVGILYGSNKIWCRVSWSENVL